MTPRLAMDRDAGRDVRRDAAAAAAGVTGRISGRAPCTHADRRLADGAIRVCLAG